MKNKEGIVMRVGHKLRSDLFGKEGAEMVVTAVDSDFIHMAQDRTGEVDTHLTEEQLQASHWIVSGFKKEKSA